ncbi:MAG: putative gamma-glutamyltransferase YwrD [Candidatus Heimdallarchaeota archaeon LC_3]|nr:MAG: putative gamma-glutamyltransferase YwrD [Candidatus Heimdallarchaeota archaeon LC_3]
MENDDYFSFNSRRSAVYAYNGIVATSQPLASQIGLYILQVKGGNAADAAVATAAALNVVEPTSTGLGGDCFTLFYNNRNKNIFGINGSGRAPKELSINYLNNIGVKDTIPIFSPHTVTVPGAAAGWIDTIEKFGSLTIEEVLQPAINLAENGYPVSPVVALSWKSGEKQLRHGPNAKELMINNRAPNPGELMKIPTLAKTMRAITEQGKKGFYEGVVAESIIDLLNSLGGVMTLDDLKNHKSIFVDPISVNYHGIDIYEIPPNGQGITALLALKILEEFNLEEKNPYSAEYLHIMIEAMRLAFADSRWYVTDPEFEHIPISQLLSNEYARERKKLILPDKATLHQVHGSPTKSSDTIYLSVIDKDGNACSFINSLYMGFGTGLIPKNTGVSLQNRGANFSLNPNHPNALKPNKRPYHTIIPAMALKDNELYASFGVMGGFMQPQGQVQVLTKMVDHGYDPQQALDAPRFCITDGTSGGVIALEEGIPQNVINKLSLMGHDVHPVSGWLRNVFGRGQIIRRNPQDGVIWAGSDPRADGCAVGY